VAAALKFDVVTDQGAKTMATDTTIEGRLEALEQAFEELKRKLEERPISPNWLDQVIGILKDEPEFHEVIRLGREFRMADRPKDDDES
jgi:hypothetical protein